MLKIFFFTLLFLCCSRGFFHVCEFCFGFMRNVISSKCNLPDIKWDFFFHSTLAFWNQVNRKNDFFLDIVNVQPTWKWCDKTLNIKIVIEAWHLYFVSRIKIHSWKLRAMSLSWGDCLKNNFEWVFHSVLGIKKVIFEEENSRWCLELANRKKETKKGHFYEENQQM